jgi:hypothetical protein
LRLDHLVARTAGTASIIRTSGTFENSARAACTINAIVGLYALVAI